jgi:predicted  nucleic acid-binding Zn-ribbon protein
LAIVFQQVAFAVVPPVCALSFNIVNRSRRIQELRMHGLSATNQTSQLRSDLQSIQSSMHNLPLADRIVEIEHCLRRISEATIELQQQQADTSLEIEDDRQKLKEAFAIVRQGVYNLSHHTNTSLDRLRAEMERIEGQVEPTARRVAQEIANATVAPVQQQADLLEGRFNILEEEHHLLTPEVRQLTQAVTHLRTHTAQHWLSEIDRRLESVLPYTYSIVPEDASDYLLKALGQAKEQVLIVTPWLEYDRARAPQLLKALENLLEQNVFVSFGWGRRADVGRARGTNRPIALKDGGWRYQPERDPHGYYRLLPHLLELKKRHKRLTLKLLGTAERVVVCDRDWALLGGHHQLCRVTSETPELGLYTNDPHVVYDLVDRFNLVPHLQRRRMPTPQSVVQPQVRQADYALNSEP